MGSNMLAATNRGQLGSRVFVAQKKEHKNRHSVCAARRGVES